MPRSTVKQDVVLLKEALEKFLLQGKDVKKLPVQEKNLKRVLAEKGLKGLILRPKLKTVLLKTLEEGRFLSLIEVAEIVKGNNFRYTALRLSLAANMLSDELKKKLKRVLTEEEAPSTETKEGTGETHPTGKSEKCRCNRTKLLNLLASFVSQSILHNKAELLLLGELLKSEEAKKMVKLLGKCASCLDTEGITKGLLITVDRIFKKVEVKALCKKQGEKLIVVLSEPLDKELVKEILTFLIQLLNLNLDVEVLSEEELGAREAQKEQPCFIRETPQGTWIEVVVRRKRIRIFVGNEGAITMSISECKNKTG